MTIRRRLTCCVCGADAGLHHQWWNRDTGFGICLRCADEQSAKLPPEEMRSLYGRAGLHYDTSNTVNSWGPMKQGVPHDLDS